MSLLVSSWWSLKELNKAYRLSRIVFISIVVDHGCVLVQPISPLELNTII